MSSPIIVVFCSLFFMLTILSMYRLKREPYGDYYIDIACNDPKATAIDKDVAEALCEKCCTEYAEKEHENKGDKHGWKPFSFWSNEWYQYKIWNKKTNRHEHQLFCRCNLNLR